MRVLGVITHPGHRLHHCQVYLVALHDSFLLAVVLVEHNGWRLGGAGHTLDHCPASIHLLVGLETRHTHHKQTNKQTKSSCQVATRIRTCD